MSSPLANALLAELDEDALDALAERIAPRVAARIDRTSGEPDGWLTTRAAAAYLGLSVVALHKLTAAQAVPFEQEGPGCRCWFRCSELDEWVRAGRPAARALRAA
ncbi:MAG: helix-turn-helix domain-containing protein [Solirubrobacteraceae bacterium]